MDVKSLIGRAFAWPARTFKSFGADRAAPIAASIAFREYPQEAQIAFNFGV
ncbi:hypothetical protein [Caballeronia sp. GaOx3]|jgi:membrane protein|uniref:hypothetical protein n=1 Tax=Caballeronia sp. GaOx3 TaxID=2921740 RepID=UPI0020289B6B|nr:hypothetical protein [Caballeronia sp. GaOx3]